jgi:hypothetical protein
VKSFILIAALLAATPAAAQGTSHDACQLIYNLSTRIMEMRQEGMSMPEAMSYTGDLPDPAWVKMAKYITREAYGVRLYDNMADQETAISEFANDQAAECYRVAAETGYEE